LTRLDFAVISHRHGDHADGLRHLLRVNPNVTIYVPDGDEYFGGPTPPVFFTRPDESLPEHLRYFNGAVPKDLPHGTPWGDARFVRVDGSITVMPGVQLVRNLSPGPAFAETPEVSLLIDTPQGRLLVVGCSHPGIERILGAIDAKQTRVDLVVGGLHLVTAPDAEVERLTRALREEWKLGGVAPGHCTGERAFGALRRAFGTRYIYAGVGSVLSLP
jgi:7,8-dihydropterin-6-yl-methyl-4-(beta-D-ribofuranosyl)aminobenzene 5'-phosphate synthase